MRILVSGLLIQAALLTPVLGAQATPLSVGDAVAAALTDYWALSVNAQYPVFTGFRVREAIALARLQADSKLVGVEMVKRALIFEVRRAYWEASRATLNRQTLEKKLELMKAASELTTRQASQGTATHADQLTADARLNQADIDLGDAVSQQNRAFLYLATLIGKGAAAQDLSARTGDTLRTSMSKRPSPKATPLFVFGSMSSCYPGFRYPRQQ